MLQPILCITLAVEPLSWTGLPVVLAHRPWGRWAEIPPQRQRGFCRQFSFESLSGMLAPCDPQCNLRRETMAVRCKGAQFPQAVLVMGVRWSVAYPLSTRQVAERMEDRGGGGSRDHQAVGHHISKICDTTIN
jgi:hypothetical protein